MIHRFLCLSLLGSISAAAPTPAPPGEGWFPFPVSARDEGSPGVIDLSFLNETPAGKSGFVRIDGERFVDGAGRELRWFGTNLVASGCFPQNDEAPKLAAHLAGLGLNIVRMHFLDNQWGGDSLLLRPNYKEWNTGCLDRLHFFLNELKKRGIYSNLNLHVGRVYEGTPKGGPDFSKGLDLFYPPFIEAFKEYCRRLLTTRNPCTGMTPAEDASVAVLELNNENTLVANPWWLSKLPDPFAAELRKRWTEWLRAKYRDTASLQKAYGVIRGEPGPNIAPPLPWPPDSGTWHTEGGGGITFIENGFTWTVKEPGPQPWSHQLSALKLPVKDGDSLRLAFRARAGAPRKLGLSVMHGEPPWANTGLSDQAALEKEWREFSYEFTAHSVAGKAVRLSFSALNQPGVIEIAGVDLRVLPAGYLKPDDALEAGVTFPGAQAPEPVRADAFRFLAETEIAWARDMIRFLKDELGVKVPIAHSHVLFGGMLGARREAMVGDFVDNHGYWQHPDFPNRPWDMGDWRIENTSQLAKPASSTLAEMAMLRPAGKPYTISEYDLPAPSDFAAEMWPMFAAVACQQNWSGIYSYCFINGAGAWDGRRLHGFFEQSGHPAKHGLMPAAALVFRLGLVQPHRTSIILTTGCDALFADCTGRNGDLWGSWRRFWETTRTSGEVALTQRTAVRVLEGDEFPKAVRGDSPAKAPIESEWLAADGRWLLRAPAARAAVGRLGEGKIALGDLHLEFPALAGPGSACFMMVAVDGKSLDVSGKVLLCTLQRAENPGMQWSAGRKTVGRAWGRAPAHVLALPCTVKLPGAAWQVDLLDSTGRITRRLSAATQTLTLSAADQTMWYWLTR